MKKILSGILAAAMAVSCFGVSALAAGETGDVEFAGAYNETGESVTNEINVLTTNKIGGDQRVSPNKVFYVPIENYVPADATAGTSEIPNPTWSGSTTATTRDLKDKDLFKFDYDKDTNSKMVKSVSLVTDKKIGNVRYDLAVKFELADTMTTSEIHTDGTITFTAKKDSPAGHSTTFTKGDEVEIDYSFYINNDEKGNDDNADAGDRIYYKPEKNETNSLIWGDDLAALTFDADDDAGKFYARLSTTADRSIYADYADPVDADVWFFDFVGNPSIPSTSRATLVLGQPWDEDADYAPNPQDVFVYERSADGTLTDVTAQFNYSEDEYEIPGWAIKTRTLGSYILSDTELDVELVDEDEAPASSDASSSKPAADKDIPQTGSSDMVNVAVVAAVVSLAAAGALACRKVSK